MFYKWRRWTAKKDGYLARAGHSVLYKAETGVWLYPMAHCATDWVTPSTFENLSVTVWVTIFTLCRWYTFHESAFCWKFELEEKCIVVWKSKHLNKSDPHNLPAQTPFCIMYEGCRTWGFHLWLRKRQHWWYVDVTDSSLLNKMSGKLVWRSQTMTFIIRQTLYRWSPKLTRPNSSTTSNFENLDTFFAWSVSISTGIWVHYLMWAVAQLYFPNGC